MPQIPSVKGKVILVGAGPGDPELMTLRGVRCLQSADVVIYDYLVNPQILRHAPTGAELICLGRHGRSRIWSQSEINQQLVQLAKSGKTVVRLKGGDPAVFARGAEEIEVLAAHEIPFEVVPGITAALAAGSYAGIPITHRQLASAVALVTGQEDADKPHPDLNYRALAEFPGTLVFYMGVTTAPKWTAALIDAGMPADTPAAIIRRCSLADQKTLRCTLSEVPDRLARPARIRPPAIVMVGPVAALSEDLCWFDRRPLFGTRVMVTRPIDQADALIQPLSDLGAEVLIQPAIEITPPDDWSDVDAALARLDQFDWLVFSSANGVRYLLNRLRTIGRDWRSLGQLKLAAIGPGTAAELSRYFLDADLQPHEFRAEALAASLADEARGKRFLLTRASRGREVLADQLQQAGAAVEQIVVYNSRDVAAPDEEIAQRLAAGQVDWVTVTSSAIARSLAAMFGDDLQQTRLASISPVTSDTLRGLGLQPAAEATRYTMEGVIEAVLNAAD